MYIVVNRCFGGFSLSKAAQERLGVDTAYPDIPRDDPRLVEVVQEMGEKASGQCASLRAVFISDSATDWTIQEYDGDETIIYVLDGYLHFA